MEIGNAIGYISTTSNQGWQCPGCSRCFAPFISECSYCGKYQITYTPTWPYNPGPTWYNTPSTSNTANGFPAGTTVSCNMFGCTGNCGVCTKK